MRQKYEKNQESTDESLRSALSKLATASQQTERELASRKSLERSMEELTTQLEHDKRQLQARYAQELEKRRHEWSQERETLLALIQKDCNSAIERHRKPSSKHASSTSATKTSKAGKLSLSPSPFRATNRFKSAASNDDDDDFYLTVQTALSGGSSSNNSPGGGSSEESESARLVLEGSSSPSPRTKSVRVSPVYSDIDTVLRETEDLIESIG